MKDFAILGVIVVALIGALPGMLALRGQRKLMEAKAAASLTAAASGLVDDLQEEVHRLRDSVRDIEAQNFNLRQEWGILQETSDAAFARIRDLEVKNRFSQENLRGLERKNIELRADNRGLVKELARLIDEMVGRDGEAISSDTQSRQTNEGVGGTTHCAGGKVDRCNRDAGD